MDVRNEPNQSLIDGLKALKNFAIRKLRFLLKICDFCHHDIAYSAFISISSTWFYGNLF